MEMHQVRYFLAFCETGQSLDLGGPIDDGGSSGARGQPVGTQVVLAPIGSRLAAIKSCIWAAILPHQVESESEDRRRQRKTALEIDGTEKGSPVVALS